MRLRLTSLAVFAVFALLAFVAPALAGGNATAEDAYDSSTPSLTPPQSKPGALTPPTATTPQVDAASGSGNLPFTGMDVGLLLVGGAVIGLAGVGMRRLGRDDS